MNDTVSSRQMLVSILGVIILIIALVGISFATFTYSKTGEKANAIITGTITMSYSEPTNGINLTNALPITDTAGKELNGDNNTFDFTVSATIAGDTNISYAITAVKDATSDIPDTGIKVYLASVSGTNETAVFEPKLVSALSTTSSDASGAPDGQYLLKTGNYKASSKENYRLRMWVDENYGKKDASATDTNTTEFAAEHKYILKVNVYGAAKAQ